MKNVTVIDHPILLDKLTVLRTKSTMAHSFRAIMSELSSLMAYEATRDLSISQINIETPIENTNCPKIGEDLITVAILRSGIAMQDGILKTVPFSKVGHIGIYRDKFIKNTIEYYFKLPDNCSSMNVLLCDPLIATGDTMIAACNRLKEYEVGKIKILSLIVSKQALEKLYEHHPDVNVFCISIENEVTQEGYLKPGIGDVGDRLYGTF